MATLTKRIRGGSLMFEIQFFAAGKRKTIPLGKKFTEKIAKELLEIVEVLLHCQTNGIEFPGKKTVSWIETASPEIRKKLGKAGLIEVPETYTLKELWDMFLAQKTDVKESTIGQYDHAKRRFFEFFQENEILSDLTQMRMKQWKESLKGTSAESTVAGTLTKAKAVFNWAVQSGMIEESPLSGVGRGDFANKSRDQFVTMTEYHKLLDASPCQDWRTVISLVRIGGLRCPSEIIPLTWADVNWEQDRFYVRSPKTERHQDKVGRWVPLFPELKKELETLFFMPESEGQEFVISRYRKQRQNLGTTFAKIVKRAGLSPIMRPFDNMRASRSNEVYDRFGVTKESEWIGHSAKVRKDHYGMITDDDYELASNWTIPVDTKKRVFPAIESKRQQTAHRKELEIVGQCGH